MVRPKDVFPASAVPVLVVTGMAKEMRLAAGPDSVVLGSGGDPRRLRQLLAERGAPGCRAVLSFGIAGSLDPALAPGDVVISTGVVAGDDLWAAHPPMADLLADSLAAGGLRPVRAAIAGAELVVMDAAAKRRIRSATGAAAVDMESHVAADYAARAGLPFVALRVICDPAARALPPLALTALRADGTVDLVAVLNGLARRPVQLAAMLRVASDARAAFAALGRCRDLLGIGRGFPDFGELLSDVA